MHFLTMNQQHWTTKGNRFNWTETYGSSDTRFCTCDLKSSTSWTRSLTSVCILATFCLDQRI